MGERCRGARWIAEDEPEEADDIRTELASLRASVDALSADVTGRLDAQRAALNAQTEEIAALKAMVRKLIESARAGAQV